MFSATASSPMAVLAGAIVATYASTGVTGTPLGFVVIAAALLFFSVGYLAMARYVSSAGVFYAALAAGFGRFWGVVAAPVVLLGYNAIQICLYGLLGAAVSGSIGGTWWVWSLVAWAAVASVGVLKARISVGLLGAVLAVEVAVILLFILTSFTHPAGGSVSFAPLNPSNLLVPGIGGVVAFCAASFVGYESAAVYSEESRSPQAVSKAAYSALILLAVLYALAAWALAVAVGPDKVVDQSRDPSSGLPFSILETHASPLLGGVATVLVVTSVFAAMVSFHNSVARYAFSLGRERVLPAVFEKIGRGGAPVAGSVLQSAIALPVILIFALTGADPVAIMFSWLSGVAAIAVLLMMAVTSLAAIAFFRKGGGGTESAWQRTVAPLIGAVLVSAALLTTLVNLSAVLGAPADSMTKWLVPGAVAAAAVIGLIWAAVLKATRPEVLKNVGQGQLRPLAVIEQDLIGRSL
ncbi:APC family permease [Micromonospora yasonensis]|uniref:APC family permease n=1 Tax=Micromonospora yasonensis TaxID=1128667 RepID=UPI00222E8D7F|nr:APC family permease [Micromonospora yasonensis]MCW3844493.1 APC family permease [Micromonospora yasonensis]